MVKLDDSGASETLSQREACRRMVNLLWLAHDEGCEAELGLH